MRWRPALPHLCILAWFGLSVFEMFSSHLPTFLYAGSSIGPWGSLPDSLPHQAFGVPPFVFPISLLILHIVNTYLSIPPILLNGMAYALLIYPQCLIMIVANSRTSNSFYLLDTVLVIYVHYPT